MIASMGSDIKPFALSPSSFFHWSNQRGHKRTSATVRKEYFPGGLVYPPCITHRSYHVLWVGYSKLISGLIAVACVLMSELTGIYNVKRARLVLL